MVSIKNTEVYKNANTIEQKAFDYFEAFYPKIFEGLEIQSDDTTWNVMQRVLAEIYEVKPQTVLKDNFRSMFVDWAKQVKGIIGNKLWDAIKEILTKPYYLFSNYKHKYPELDPDVATALWLFKHLPIDGVTIHDLLPMYKTTDPEVIDERKKRFNAFIHSYRYDALLDKKRELEVLK